MADFQENVLLTDEDFDANPEARIPICLCLDVSGSMGGDPIYELNEGLKIFYRAVMEDEQAQAAADVTIVTFGDEIEVVRDFGSIRDIDLQNYGEKELQAYGSTPMGEAVEVALDHLQKRKESYKKHGIDYYQPWLILMTDGTPNGDAGLLHRMQEAVRTEVANKKLTIVPIAIGKAASTDALGQFTPDGKVCRLKGLNFREFFTWLSKSVAKISQSIPGEFVPLDPPLDWQDLSYGKNNSH